MTTVAGLARDGHVVMAADTMTAVYDRPIPDGCRKIRRYPTAAGNDALIGVSGRGALATVLDADLDLPEVTLDPDDLGRWANDVARKAAAVAVASQLTDSDGDMDGFLLLGYGGRLWTLVHCYAIPHHDSVAALGSGEGPAIGAMDALLACTDLSLVEVVTRAVGIAAERDRHSGAPVQVEYLPA